MRKYIPTAATVFVLSVAVGVLQDVWGWSNTATNLAAIGVVAVSMVVFAKTAAPDSPHRNRCA
jgi:hypothetical protein